MTAEQTAREAEQTLLGAMLLSPAALWTALDIIRPEDFYDPRHEALVRVMAALGNAGIEVDLVTVADELLRRGIADKVSIDYLHTLTSQVTTTANAAYWADIVQRHAGLRRAARAAALLGQGVADGRDVYALIDDAKDLLEQAGDSRGAVAPIGDSFDDLVGQLDQAPGYHPTPWQDLNALVHGLMPGGLYIIAARPGAGKTIAAVQLAVDLAQHGNVVYHSLEMPKAQLYRRILAAEATIPLTRLITNRLTREDWEQVRRVRPRIMELPLYIDDRTDVSITQIESYARQVARRGKLAGVVVDYLQLIPNRDGRKARWEHVGELTRNFKLLAKDLGVPVVVLSQLNRESEKNQRLPTLSDLRESGSIEQDADVVILQQRRIEDDGLPGDTLDVIVAKNRHGAQGRFWLEWQGKYSRLADPQAAAPVDYRALQAGPDA